MGKVLIKCIQTPMQKYFYDRSLDSVVMVNDEEYQILKTVEKTKLVPDGVLRRFVKSGLLRETAIEEIEHPETENLHLLAEHYMGNLILQVTQQCNLNYYKRRVRYIVVQNLKNVLLELMLLFFQKIQWDIVMTDTKKECKWH